MTVNEISRRSFLTRAGSLAVAFTLGPVVAEGALSQAAAAARDGLRIDETTADDSLAWLVLTPSRITIHSGKVELGTGTQTAMTQIVVDELHTSMQGVDYVQGDTRVTPDQGTTAGSKTIQEGGPELRQAAATAFQALLGLAAEQLGVSRDRLIADDGVFTVSGSSRRVTYGQLLSTSDLVLVADPDAPVRSPNDYQIVGQEIPRDELADKVMARFTYIHDVRVPRMLHGRMIRPSGRNASFSSIDPASLDRARAIPGFVDVVQKGNFVGVVAETEWAAIQAASGSTGVAVRWQDGQPLVPQADLPEALRDPANQYRTSLVAETGDVDAALPGADMRVEASYSSPFQMHASMGPSCGIADVRKAPDSSGVQATIWSGTQSVYGLRAAIASLLELAPDAVHVIYEEASGCYGHNGADDVCADAALLSQAVGRPVRVQWSRQNEHGWEPTGPAMAHDMRAGMTDGTVVAWEHVAHTPTHLSRPNSNPGTLLAGALTGSLPATLPSSSGGSATRNGPVTYAFPNSRTIGKLVRSFETTGPTSGAPAAPLRYRFLRSTALRSLGGFSDSFANESFLDEVAAEAGVDPLDLRLRSLDDPRATAVVEALRDTWTARPTGGDGVGAGIAFQRYETEFTYTAAYVEVAVDTDTGVIRVRRVVVAHDCGLIINPDGLRNQIEGNVMQGVSRTLKEEIHFNTRGVTSVVWEQNSFNPTPQYSVLRFSDVPEVESILIDRPDQPAWGAGEPAIGTLPGAIGNAVFAATGKRIRALPMTPDRVLEALRS